MKIRLAKADRKNVKGFEPTTQGSQTEVRTDLIMKAISLDKCSSDWFVLVFNVLANKYWRLQNNRNIEKLKLETKTIPSLSVEIYLRISANPQKTEIHTKQTRKQN